MGCCTSRIDTKRMNSLNNFAVIPYGFHVVDAKHPKGFSPMDQLSLISTNNRDFNEYFGEIENYILKNEKISQELQIQILSSILGLHTSLIDYYDGKQSKPLQVKLKYSSQDAIDQIEGVLRRISDKKVFPNFLFPAKPQDVKSKEEFEQLQKYSEFYLGSGEGQQSLPKVLLDCMILFPYFADMVKVQILSKEFGGSSNSILKNVASITSAAIFKAQQIESQGVVPNLFQNILPGSQDYDIYFSSYLSDEDILDIDESHQDNQNKVLIFPGVIFGYRTAEQAIQSQFKEGLNAQMVLFHVKSNAAKLAGGEVLAVHRLFAKVIDFKENRCRLEKIREKFQNMSDYKKAVDNYVPIKKDITEKANNQ